MFDWNWTCCCLVVIIVRRKSAMMLLPLLRDSICAETASCGPDPIYFLQMKNYKIRNDNNNNNKSRETSSDGATRRPKTRTGRRTVNRTWRGLHLCRCCFGSVQWRNGMDKRPCRFGLLHTQFFFCVNFYVSTGNCLIFTVYFVGRLRSRYL